MTWDGVLAFGLTVLTLFLLWVAVHMVIDVVQDRRREQIKDELAKQRRERMRRWGDRK